MTTFTALSDSTLQLDKPLTEAVARAGMRDNLQATIEGDASAPRIQPRSMDSPYFFAKRTTDYTVATPAGSAWKVAFDTEVYDPDNLYDNTANSGNGYRFKPNKAGVYLVNLFVQLQTISTAPGTPSQIGAVLYKNGSVFAQALGARSGNTNGSLTSANLTALVQLNGTTDYIEGWVNDGVSSGLSPSNPVQGTFSAVGICQI